MNANSNAIKDKYLNEFIAFFNGVSSAASLIRNIDIPQIWYNKLNATIEDLNRQVEEFENMGGFKNLMDEIEGNLYSLSEINRIIYIKNILRDFEQRGKIQFFDRNTKYKRNDMYLGETTTIYPLAEFTLGTLEKYFIWEVDLKNAKPAEKYIIYCFQALENFATLLDMKCLDFNIDMHSLQKGIGIFLQRTRRWEELIRRGYKQKEILNLGTPTDEVSGKSYKNKILHFDDNIENIGRLSDFNDLFDNEQDAKSCLFLMQKLRLIKQDGTHQIGDREKARLMAFVEALQHRALLPPAIPTADITLTIAKQIKLDYQRPRSGDRKKYDDFRTKYQSTLNAISTNKLTWLIMVDDSR